MSRSIVVLLSILFPLCTQLFATQVSDSLRSQLLTTQTSVGRCTTLIKLADLVVVDSFPAALDMYKEASQLAESERFQDGIAMVNNSLMTAYTTKGAYALALEYGQRSLQAALQTGNNKRVANSCINLGNVHFYIENLEEAMAYYKRAISMLDLDANPLRTSALMLNIGAVYQEMNRPDSAIHYFERSMIAVGKMEMPSDYMYSALRNNVGNLYLDRDEFEAALKPFHDALEYAIKSGDLAQVATVKMNLGLAYSGLRDWKSASAYLASADSMIVLNELSIIKPELYEGWALFYEEQGLYGKALEYRKFYEQVKDSLEGQENKEAVAQLQTAYDSERQRDQISLLEYEREKHLADEQAQQRMLFGVLGGLGFAILCTILLFRYYRRQQRINLMLEGLNREKDGLISIVAHDLKAPLNKTKMLVELLKTSTEITDEQAKLLTMIDKVVTDGGLLIQDLLEITLPADVKRDEQLQRCDLVQLTDGMTQAYAANATKKQLQIVQLHAEAAIELFTNRQPLERILDNLLSNAIKFSPPGRSIYLSTRKDQGFAYFSVRDEGPGIGPEDQKKMFGKFQKLSARPTAGESSNGLGLSIVKALVDRLEGEIEVKSTLGVGTEFVVKVPINGAPR